MTVDGLFASLPVRAQRLEADARRSARELTALVSHYALLRPAVAFRLELAADVFGSSAPLVRGALPPRAFADAVAVLFGSRVRAALVELDVCRPAFRLHALVPQPAPSAVALVMRSTRERTFVAVNDRPVEVRIPPRRCAVSASTLLLL